MKRAKDKYMINRTKYKDMSSTTYTTDIRS